VSDRWQAEWWSVRLPDGWAGEMDGDTTLISAEGGPGLLQIRAFHSDGRDIEDDDLRELAKHHVDGGAVLLPMRYGSGFTGFHVHYESEGVVWWEWWLRCGRLAIHATYHCPDEARSEEAATIAGILNTIRYGPPEGSA
jgi:hypothetical protein